MKRVPKSAELAFKAVNIAVGDHHHQTPKLHVSIRPDAHVPVVGFQFSGTTYSGIPIEFRLSTDEQTLELLIERLTGMLEFLVTESEKGGRYEGWR